MKPTHILGAVVIGFSLVAGSKVIAADESSPISYACDEVVVIGRVKTVGYADLTREDDLLGHGRYSMQVSISRVLRGRETRRVVPASGYSHGQMREDADFWMVLAPASDGAYVIRTANLTRIPYKVASKCG